MIEIVLTLDEATNTTIIRLSGGYWYNDTTGITYPPESYTAMFYERFLKEKLAELASEHAKTPTEE